MTRSRIASLIAAASVALLATAAVAGPLLGSENAPPPPDAPVGAGECPRGPRGPHGPGGPEGPGGPGFGAFDGPMHHALGELRGAVRFWDDEDTVAELGLTADQIAALEESHKSTVEAAEALDGSVRDAYKSLHETVEGDDATVDSVNAAVDAATAAQAEAMKIALGHRLVVKSTLTPEQEEALRESRREHVGKRLAEVRERFGPEGEIGARIRERIGKGDEQGAAVRERVRTLMQDGDLSDADWAEIDGELRRTADERIQQVRERIRQLEAELDGAEGALPPPPPGRGRGEGAPPRGPRRDG